ncbi:HNH endonuclease [Mammaliicoccus vitulinus]|uniref:NUMOD4 motif-containing HNH endonuclease n=1 Tax=Mammaliicoccus vitulinus TaxID=71237 RepID=UPI00194F000A|nr:NUMOD4 motif-containing HNH endonuclease [Mammaliicoccus vitulinus]MBM6630328.1 HNH endonuclease [Mammaliicoccus vitulinus]
MNNTNEEWKDVVGYEGLYEVSNMGNVRSIKFKEERILKQFVNTNGRLQVGLSKDGKKYNKYPHSLVAESFIGERPEGYDVCHLDGDYTNNKLTNIRYDTGSENQIDFYRQGKKSNTGKLSIEQVLEIRRLYATGKYTLKELAKEFNVSLMNISYIVNRKTFPWLNDDGSIDDSVTSVS